MATYVNDLRLKEIATGDEAGTWGTSTNTNLELIAEAFSFGTEAITTNADTHTTTIADGSTDPGRSIFLKYTGTLDSTCTITLGPNTVSKLWIIENGTSGSQSIIIKQGSGATVTIPTGKTRVVYSDGAGSGGAIVDAFASLNLETSGIIETSSSIQTPLIEFTDGDDAMSIADGGQVTFAQSIIGTLGTAAQPNITSLGTLTTLTVDDITINASTISDSGDFTIDSGGDISLDADGGDIRLKDGGTEVGTITLSASALNIRARVEDKDIIFKGNDGGSTITALQLDMSAAGAATFNDKIIATELDISGDIDVDGTTNLDVVDIDGAVDMASTLAVGGATTFGGDITISEATPTITFTDTDNNYDATIAGLSGSLILTADANAEFGTETIQFHTGGSQRAQFDASGNLGLGTTSPSAELDVVGSSTPAVRVADSSGFNVRLEAFGSNAAGLVCAGGSTNMTFQTNETERMRIDSSGNVGINSTSPQKALDIAGASSSGGAVMRLSGTGEASQGDVTGAIQFHNADTTDNTAGVFGIIRGVAGASGGEGNIQILTDMPSEGADASTVAMHISSTAKVGIGTTSPDAKLDVVVSGSGTQTALILNNSHGYGSGVGTAASALQFRRDSGGSGEDTPSAQIHSGNESETTSNPSNLVFSTKNSSGTLTEAMRLNSDGDLGIGTTAPGTTFHVRKTNVSATYSLAARYVTQFERNGACDISILGSSSNGSAVSFSDEADADVGRLLYQHTDNSLRITVNTAEAMRIDNGQNVMVNRTSKIGTNRFSVNFASGSSEKGVGINSSDAGATTHMTFLVEANAKGSITTDGSNTTYNTSSDARLKDVTGEARGLEVINELNPVSYSWKETGISDEGLIAQEVEKLVPNAVVQDDDEYYQMDYSKLVTHLVKGMQEQQEQIELLKSEIENLKGE